MANVRGDTMSGDHQVLVRTLFDKAMELPMAARESFLKEACGDNGEVFREVTELVSAYERASPHLDAGVEAFSEIIFDDPSDHAQAPEYIRHYRIVKLLGHGGMGSVYLAERGDLGGLVAIKLLRDPWGPQTRWQRFEEEKRTLSSLNHGNIAALYDHGIHNDHGGTPWFAMEYVDGYPITEYCRINLSSLEQRLSLFRAACKAVDSAHRGFVVHLDLKPSNIFVNTDGQVKLLDFGISKQLAAIEGEVAQNTHTLRPISANYAAPEQIQGERVGVDTDVHALGVVLYELLVGSVPQTFQKTNPEALLRRVHENPEKPSVAAARRGGATEASGLAPVQTGRLEWNDLDVLCLKAMHLDRQRRYLSVSDLAQDVDHFLTKRPLMAQPDSVSYRASKFIHRHRGTVVSAAIVLTAVVAMVSFFIVRLVEARDRALSAQARTERIQQLMLHLFQGDDQAAGPAQSLRVVELLDRGVREAQALRDDPALQAELEYTLGGLYHKLGYLDRAQPLLVSSLGRRRELLGASHPDAVRSMLALSNLRTAQSEIDDSIALAEEARRMITTMQPRPDLLFADSLATLGSAHSANGSYETAEPLLEEVIEILKKRPPTAALSEATGALTNNYYYQGKFESAEKTNWLAMKVDRELYGETHPQFAIGLFNLGNIELDRGNYAQASDYHQRSLNILQSWHGPNHPRTVDNLVMLGRAQQYQRRFKEAASFYSQALHLIEGVKGINPVRVGQIWNHLGLLSLERGDLDDAESSLQKSAKIFGEALGEDHGFTVYQQSNLAAVYVARYDLQRAEKILRPVVDRLETAMGTGNRYAAVSRNRLANCLAKQNRYREAEEQASIAYTTLKDQMSFQTAEVQSAGKDLVSIYEALGKHERANHLKTELSNPN